MASYYCEPGKYGAYSAVPAGSGWPLNCQDGDGQLGPNGVDSNLAVTSHVEIDCTNITAGASAYISVLGVSITATNGQSGATLAAALAASIQSGSAPGTTPITFQPTGWTTPQLREAVYARATGAVLEIMTRAGSASYNGQQIVAANMAGWPGTNPAFSGGVSGSWGHLFNTAAIFASAVAIGQYGCVFTANATGTYIGKGAIAGPVAGLSFADSLFVRSGLNGSNLTLSLGVANLPISQAAKIIVDDGTIWASDTNTVLTIQLTGNGNSVTTGNTGKRVMFGARTTGRLVIQNMAGGYSVSVGPSYYGSLTMANCVFLDTQGKIMLQINTNSVTGYELAVMGGRYACTRNAFYAPIAAVAYASYASITVDGLEFDWTGSSYAGASNIYLADCASVVSYPQHIAIRNCKMSYLPNGQPASFGNLQATFPAAVGIKLVSDNNKGVALSSVFGLMGGNTNAYGYAEQSFIVQQGIGLKDQFRYESNATVVDANIPGVAYPVPSSSTFSFGVSWGNSTYSVRPGGIEVLKLKKTVEAAITNAAVEIFLDSAVESQINQGYIAATATYLATDGVVYTDHSNGLAGNAMMNPASLAVTAETWDTTGFSAYSGTAKKMSIALTHTPVVGSGVEVSVKLLLPAPSNTQVFISPEVSLS